MFSSNWSLMSPLLFYMHKKSHYHFLRLIWFWQRKFMFEIAQFWQEVRKRLGSIFEQWTKLHFKLNLERTLMHEPLVCKWTERISLSLCTWSQMVESLLTIFLSSYTLPPEMFGPFGSLWCKMALGEVGLSLPWQCHSLVLLAPGNWRLFLNLIFFLKWKND